jgi:hypothetical protein
MVSTAFHPYLIDGHLPVRRGRIACRTPLSPDQPVSVT